MKKTLQESFDVQIFLINPLVRNGKASLFRQIYENIRQAILSRRLRAGVRLPSTRFLADQLAVSRNTVINAFEQLTAEGYLVGKPGKGTFVTEELPDDLLHTRTKKNVLNSEEKKSKRKIGKRGEKLTEVDIAYTSKSSGPRLFQTGMIATDEFPIELWTKTATKFLRKMPRRTLNYGQIQGFEPLREAIAKYLGASRGVICEPSQIVVTSGSQQGLDLAARILLDKDDEAWIEDPCYKGAFAALSNAEVNVVPVPLDDNGINIKKGVELSKKPRAVCVTPSHQFPTGIVMSLSRRLELLEWANDNSVWIIEDDYDSEFRYEGKPFAALQGLDTYDRVIYVGTFSKVLFPSMRVGYLVLPPDLVHFFIKGLRMSALHAPILEQSILTEFINQGHFGRHIRKMRKLYAERQKILVNELKENLSEFLTVEKDAAGMHVIAWLKEGLKDTEIAEKALENGIYAAPLSFSCINRKLPDALVLGYSGFSKTEIRRGVKKLRKTFL